MIRFCELGNRPFPAKAPKSPSLCFFLFITENRDETGEYWDFHIEFGNIDVQLYSVVDQLT